VALLITQFRFAIVDIASVMVTQAARANFCDHVIGLAMLGARRTA